MGGFASNGNTNNNNPNYMSYNSNNSSNNSNGYSSSNSLLLLSHRYFLPPSDVFHDFVVYLESILKDLHTVEGEQNVLIEIYML